LYSATLCHLLGYHGKALSLRSKAIKQRAVAPLGKMQRPFTLNGYSIYAWQ
jgi:hypothetical protein